MRRYVTLKDIGNEAEITAMVKRLELRGKVSRKAPLSPEEIERELTRIKNEKLRKGIA